jgi:hypothetical protein
VQSPQHVEYVVEAGTAQQMAVAVFRYRLTQPAFLAILALELVFAAVFAATGRPVVALVFVLLALSMPLFGWLRLPRLSRMLQARGFRPGASVSTDWDADRFVVTSSAARSVHRYDEVVAVRQFGTVLAIKLRAARALLVLPEQLVPATVRPRLAPVPRDGP